MSFLALPGGGGALATYPSKLSPQFFYSSRPGGCICAHCTPWLRLWNYTSSRFVGGHKQD